jgi:hypothetical protein
MKPFYKGEKVKNLGEQMLAIRKKYTNFDVNCNYLGLTVFGQIQPTSRSEVYNLEIQYCMCKPPEIYIKKPKLIKNFNGEKIPHVYPGNKLCLYRPKYAEFKHSDFIADTIIPWITLWLYHYEVWHNTGEWKGGGEHPKLKKVKK